MLVLFETPSGHALFKVVDEAAVAAAAKAGNGSLESSPGALSGVLKLAAFSRFTDTTAALASATALVEGKASKDLRKFLKKHVTGEADKLAVGDAKLGAAIREKLGVTCVADSSSLTLMRAIRANLGELLGGTDAPDGGGGGGGGDTDDGRAMALGLAHSLSRYKLKFSPDKVDVMVVQAIGLLDELDKQVNTYGMRLREWFGWHFPEMSKIVTENVAYARAVAAMRVRTAAAGMDFSSILDAATEAELKAAAVVSMGTEISDEDVTNMASLCSQVVTLSEYRTTLYEYLRSRMAALAPNLTALVGELVGARLIAHAGSVLALAKYPASTVQILGAEKALFRALKTKHATPKYGLIYHASLVGQAAPKLKGKVSRVLAAKCSLAVRVDALAEDGGSEVPEVGLDGRAKVEARLRSLEDKGTFSISRQGRTRDTGAKHLRVLGAGKSATGTYAAGADMLLTSPAAALTPAAATDAGADAANGDTGAVTPTDKPKEKKDKKDKKEKEKKEKKEKSSSKDKEAAVAADATPSAKSASKKEKKDKKAAAAADLTPDTKSGSKKEKKDKSSSKKDKKRKSDDAAADAGTPGATNGDASHKKKKSKKSA
ncbi:hypothetical protein MMPV_008648 [Pyropia vietnamensis]